MPFKQLELFQSPLVKKAFVVAVTAHWGQNRETSFGNVPTISHPTKVAELLQSTMSEGDDSLVAAALVHDVVEDTAMTVKEIQNKLGSDVANLVDEMTVDPALKGSARRSFQLSNLDNMSARSKDLKIADCTINLLNMAFDPPEHWTIVNKVNYLDSRKKIIKSAQTNNLQLLEKAQEAIEIAERAVFVAVREKVKEKGSENSVWKKDISNAEGILKGFIERAKTDLELQKKVFDDDGLPVQIDETLDEIYTTAPKAQKEITSVLTNLADMYDFEAIIPEDLKERSRAEHVLACRYQNDASRMTDVSRAALVCKTEKDVHLAMHCLSQSYKNMVIKDRISSPPMSGYRDICLMVRTDNSHFAEIQIHLESYWNAKKYKGDNLYQQMRELCEASKNQQLTPEEKKQKRALYKESRDLYKKAGEPHGFSSQTPGNPEPLKYNRYLEKIKNLLPTMPTQSPTELSVS